MAILQHGRGVHTLKAEVLVNGSPLREYDDDEASVAPKSITKYVEAVSGAAFHVRISWDGGYPPQHGLCIRTRLDGKFVRSMTFRAWEMQTKKEYIMRGKLYTGNREKEFKFSPLTIVEDDSPTVAPDLKRAVSAAGQISVECFAAENVRPRPPQFQKTKEAPRTQAPAQPQPQRQPQLSEFRTIPEKAVKGSSLSHCASLGPLKPSQPMPDLIADVASGTKGPIATFNFKDRSKAALESLLVIPRIEDRSEEDMTPQELRDLVRQLRARDANAETKVKRESMAQRSVKRERDFDGDDDEVEITGVSKRPKPARQVPSADDDIVVLD